MSTPIIEVIDGFVYDCVLSKYQSNNTTSYFIYMDNPDRIQICGYPALVCCASAIIDVNKDQCIRDALIKYHQQTYNAKPKA